MPLRLLLVPLTFIALSGYAQEKGKDGEAKKEPGLIFEMGSDLSLLTSIAGTWENADYKGTSVLRLSPEPIEECRVEMGAYLRSYNVSISAKVFARQKRRIKSRMGVGLFGGNGFILRLAPGRNRIELVQYGEVIAEAPLKWDAQSWQHIELKVTPEKNYWKVIGTTWGENQPKPELPTLEKAVYPSTVTHPLSGRAFLTGSPYAGFPILFDAVKVRSEAAK